MINIKSLSLAELAAHLKTLGVEKYRFGQVVSWLYQRDIADFSEMTNLSKDLRTKLSETAEILRLRFISEQISEDGTRKYLIELADGQTVESVLIPNEERITLCISSQVGCAMACRYCLTGLLGLKRNLSQFEILEQVMLVRRHLRQGEKITNIVFMGMGEPMHNLKAVIPAVEILVEPQALAIAKRKVTVSTSGLVPEMLEFGKHSDVKLAISLSATTNALRDVIVPINRKYPLEVLMEACRNYPLGNKGRITFEYVMLKDVNDHLDDAKRLTTLLANIPNKINLLPFNEFPGSEFKRPEESTVLEFQKYLMDRGFQTNIRASRGRDILGACGQLKAAMEAKSRPPVNLPSHHAA